jgi:hypothetical protein
MPVTICPGCDKPAPQEWCWDGRESGCPLGAPPRYPGIRIMTPQQYLEQTPQRRGDANLDRDLLRGANIDAVFRKYAATTRDGHVVLVVLPGEIAPFQIEMLKAIEAADDGEEYRV